MEDCIFCKIIKGDIPSEKLYEDDKVIVIKDIQPKAPIHNLVIPKEHVPTVDDFTEGHNDLVGHMFQVGSDVMRNQHDLKGYKTLFNVGKEGGQVVFHVHLHLLGGHTEEHIDNIG